MLKELIVDEQYQNLKFIIITILKNVDKLNINMQIMKITQHF